MAAPRQLPAAEWILEHPFRKFHTISYDGQMLCTGVTASIRPGASHKTNDGFRSFIEQLQMIVRQEEWKKYHVFVTITADFEERHDAIVSCDFRVDWPARTIPKETDTAPVGEPPTRGTSHRGRKRNARPGATPA